MQRGVEVSPDQVDVAQQLSQALQRVVLALDRDQDLLARDERVDRQQAQGRRAVDEDVVQRLLVRRDRPLEPALTCDQRDQFDLRTGEVDGRGRTEQAFDIGDRLDHFRERPALDQHVVDGGHIGVVVDAQRGGGIALGVEVDDQDPRTVQGE